MRNKGTMMSTGTSDDSSGVQVLLIGIRKVDGFVVSAPRFLADPEYLATLNK